MKLIVTGGAGFVGLHLCRLLNSKFEKIIVIDIVPISYDEYPGNIEYLNIDVRNFDAINDAFKGADYVVHAAVGAMPFRTPEEIFDININGTRSVLEASMRNNVKRVIFLSSMVVYGFTDKSPVPEDAPLAGTDAYSKSKIEAEKVCEEYRRRGLCIPVIRTRTILGTERLGVFNILYDWVKFGSRIPLIGNGRNHYQLLDVEDLVDAIYLVLMASGEKVNTVFNAGAERFGTIKEDISCLCKFAKSGSSPLKTPAWLVKIILKIFAMLGLSPLHEWVYDMACKDTYYSIERIKKATGWNPKYSNADSLIRSYRWYLENCKKIKSEGITNRSPWRGGILDLVKLILRIF